MNNTIYKEHKQVGHSLLLLAIADLVKTYRGAALGWAWSLIRPSIMIGVYSFVLGTGLRAGDTIEGATYFQWLLAGILPWFYIRDMLSSGTNSFKKYKYLVTKIKFPLSTVPTFVSLSNFIVNIGLSIVVALVLIFTDVTTGITLIQIPLFSLLSFVMMTSWSLLMSPLAAISKDVKNLVKSLTQVLFWISGILYNIDSLGNCALRAVLKLNPINYIIEGYRKSILFDEWFYEDIGSLVIFLITLILLVFASVYIFNHTKDEMADAL